MNAPCKFYFMGDVPGPPLVFQITEPSVRIRVSRTTRNSLESNFSRYLWRLDGEGTDKLSALFIPLGV